MREHPDPPVAGQIANGNVTRSSCRNNALRHVAAPRGHRRRVAGFPRQAPRDRDLSMDLSPPRIMPDVQRRDIVIGVLVAMMLAALDQTIVAPALPTIGASLGDADFLSWIVSAYLLTGTAVTPLYGKLSDIHGRRPVLSLALGVFLVGSVICALAPSMLVDHFRPRRQGLGGGGLVALAQTVIADVVAAARTLALRRLYLDGLGDFQRRRPDPRRLLRAASFVVADFLDQPADRRCSLWRSPYQLEAIAADPAQPSSRLLGAALLIGATVPDAASDRGRRALAWTSPRFWFLPRPLWRSRCAYRPSPSRRRTARPPRHISQRGSRHRDRLDLLFDVRLHRLHRLSADLSGIRDRQGFRPSAGAGLIALLGGSVVGATIAGRNMPRVVHYKRMAVAGLCVAIAALAGLSFFAPNSVSGKSRRLSSCGAGVGTLFPIVTVWVQNAVDLRDLGIATATLAFLRSLGAPSASRRWARWCWLWRGQRRRPRPCGRGGSIPISPGGPGRPLSRFSRCRASPWRSASPASA